ncbi:MAG: Rieske 2Fe-2S domain-containing protein [Planctomycetes bacterium]|nr:Rieske 2Fe-2S domain-containing protein [Planctomycetota bacterium]
MSWELVAKAEDLKTGAVLYKRSPKQIAIFSSNGRVFAIDNRCPHEGYPLAEGTVDDDCVLTCNWHNWKFRLEDGKCTMGGDNVRSYPAKIANGNVYVDLHEPPPEELEREILGGLKTAFAERDYGRICREIARLHFNKLDPLAAVRHAVRWSHDRFEYGSGHAYAAMADWLALSDRFGGDWEKQLVCLAEPVDHMAFDALRRPPYPFASGGESFDSDAFREAVEAEDLQRAEGLVRRGLDDGLHWSEMEEAFAHAALAHYNDFGHSLIYVHKTGQSLARLGAELEPFLLPGLTRSLCYATREDLIPEFKQYSPALAALPPIGNHGDGARPDAPFPASTRDALSWVNGALAESSALAVYDALLEALAQNMLHFDVTFGSAFDRPVSQNVGWLGFTHGVTFANAVRNTCGKFPQLWGPGLVQMACFVGRFSSVVRGMDNPLINDYLTRTRSHTGLQLIFKKGAVEAAEEVLKQNRFLGILPDQNAGRKGVFVDFFGRKASTVRTVALLACEYEVPVVVGYCRRLGNRFRHELGVERIIWPDEWRDQPDPIHWITQQYAAAIESYVRRWPDQYLWTHRRWKTRPKDEAIRTSAGR